MVSDADALLREWHEKERDFGQLYLEYEPLTPHDQVVLEDLAVTMLVNSRVDDVDPLHGSRLRAVSVDSRPGEFVALGQAGSDAYAGLETFPNPGVERVEMTSDELTALCPITAQPDLYVATIEFWPHDLCLESKSLKLYLRQFRDEGHFCEALAVRIRDDVAEALQLEPDKVRVTLKQKSRGGISIVAAT